MSVRSLRYNTLEGRSWKGSTLATDRDALAFLEAAQVYNLNQQKAIVDLVRRLKSAGLWSKMKAIYPFIGGTASSHKWNLKDPRDMNAAFRLTFLGGWTHSSTGADPNGTNGYADTYLTPSTSLTKDSTHITAYARETYPTPTAGNVQLYMCGVYNYNQNYSIYVSTYKLKNNPQVNIGINGGSNVSSDLYSTVDSEIGFFIGSNRSTGANDHKAWRNSTNVKTNTATSANLATSKVIIGALMYSDSNKPTPAPTAYTDQQIAFATIGDGLTDSEASALYNIVDLYQKRLGRAV